MNQSLRRARRTVFQRAALTVPVAALLAVSTFTSPGHADDADGGSGASSSEVETPAPAPEPKPAPEPEPKPAPEPEPVPEPKPAPEPDAVPAGERADDGAQQIRRSAVQKAAVNDGQVCEHGEGWTKEDGLSGLTYTITAPADMVITKVCAKSATNVVTITLDPPVTSYTIVSGEGAFGDLVNGQGVPQELSHVTYVLADEPDEPEVITPPAPTLDDQCGPGNAAWTDIPESVEGKYTVTVSQDGSVVTIDAAEGIAFDDQGDVQDVHTLVETNVEPCGEGEEEKIVVCKYVGQPPGVPDHIIVVSVATAIADGWDGVLGSTYFPDQHKSVVLRYAEGNEQPGEEELANCQLAEIEPPVLTPVDVCGPDNIEFEPVEPTAEYTVEVLENGDVLLTAEPGYEFPGEEPTQLYELPDDSNEECPEAAALATCVTLVDPELPIEDARVAAKVDGVVIEIIDELLAQANGYVGTLPFTFIKDGKEYLVFAVAEPGQTADDFSVEASCVAGQPEDCVDAETNPDAVDSEGVPCNPDEGDPGDGETGGIIEDALPDTGGPAGILLPLGALMVLVGAGLVMVRRPHSA